MSNVHDDTAAGAEHPGFLQKMKDKLHIGHHKEKETTATHTDAAKSATTEPAPAAPVKEEAPTKPEGEHHGGEHTFLADVPDKDLPTEETKSHLHHVTEDEAPTKPEGEHHGGEHTFLADLPDKDLPTEETKSHLHHVTPEVHSPKPDLDSEEVFSNAQQGEHHGGVPTFIVALPDDEIPKEVTKETSEGTSTEEKEFYDSKEAPPAGNNEFFDSEEVFSKAQEGEHGGVPTFLVALPEQDIQDEKAKLHHVEAPEREPNTTTDVVDSEEVFSKAQQGEHHEGVPTFMVALPDEDINESKQKLHHVSPTAEGEGSLYK